MDYYELITEIKTKLEAAGFHSDADEITENQMILGTPGESFSSVCHFFRHSSFQQSSAFKTVEPQVRSLLKYATSIGY